MPEVNYQDLNAVLTYLAGPLGAVAWFIFVSGFIRNLREKGAFTSWQPWFMQLFVLAVSMAVPFGALAIVQNVPPAIIEGLQPWWAMLAAISIAYLVQQGYYLASKPGKDKG